MLNLNDIQRIVHISMGNMKLPFIPSVSQPRIITCNKKAPCIHSGCYAAKEKRFPQAINARMKNYNSYNNNPHLFFEAILTWIQNVMPTYFRWHVSGDIIDRYYIDSMIKIAEKNSRTNFLVYTKKYELIPNFTPKNMSVFASAWPDFELDTPYQYPVAWMQDGTETRIPENAYLCHGNCFSCKFCWHADRDVVFKKH